MPIDSAEKRPYYVLIETNNAPEGKSMKSELKASEMNARDLIAKDLLAAMVGNAHNYSMAIRREGFTKWARDRSKDAYTAADAILSVR